ncbi:MAG: hypothetical protein AAF567_00685 [Actinomycetota bacterium]
MTSALLTPLAPPAGEATVPSRVGRRDLISEPAGRLWSWLCATKGHGIWIVLWALIGWGGILLAPFVADHPLVLMLLAPRMLFLAMAIDSVEAVPFVLLGTLRLGVTDASYFIIGRRSPFAGLSPADSPTAGWFRRVFSVTARITDGLCRWLCGSSWRAGLVLFLRPNARHLGVAGAYGVSAAVAGCASVLGTIVYLTFFHLGIGLLL